MAPLLNIVRLGVLLGLLWPLADASATEVPVKATKLVVVDRMANKGKAAITFIAKDPSVSSAAALGVDTVTVRLDISVGRGAAAGALRIPEGAKGAQPSGWTLSKKNILKFSNKTAPDGPDSKSVVISPGKSLHLVARGLGEHPLDIVDLATSPTTAQTSFCVTSGQDVTCYCSSFTACTWQPLANGAGAKLTCERAVGTSECLSDVALPSCDSQPPSEQAVEQAVADSLDGLTNPMGDQGQFRVAIRRIEFALGCSLTESEAGAIAPARAAGDPESCDPESEDVNWCGPGNGCTGSFMREIRPIACLNDVCKTHDKCYQKDCIPGGLTCGFGSDLPSAKACDDRFFDGCVGCSDKGTRGLVVCLLATYRRAAPAGPGCSEGCPAESCNENTGECGTTTISSTSTSTTSTTTVTSSTSTSSVTTTTVTSTTTITTTTLVLTCLYFDCSSCPPGLPDCGNSCQGPVRCLEVAASAFPSPADCPQLCEGPCNEGESFLVNWRWDVAGLCGAWTGLTP
jgi:hypothetical protein